MKKFAKMSLVAAIAVAGMTSASAASLEEAIKGVDVSGQIRYRVQDLNTEAKGVNNEHENGTDVEVEVTAKIPVNDMVTAIVKIDNANDDQDSVTKGGVTIEDYYFQYVNGGLTVNFGQQNIPGRITDGAQGDGLVALYNTGAFTVGAAAFITNNIGANGKSAGLYLVDQNVTKTPTVTDDAIVKADGTVGDAEADLYSVIAMGSVGPVSFLGQYADAVDIADVYNVKADAKVGPVALGAEYTDLDIDNDYMDDNNDDRSTLKAYVSGSVGIVSAKLTYAKTGDNGSGSLHSLAGYSASVEAPAEFLLWQVGSATKADLDLWALDVSAAVTDKITLRAAYADGEYDGSQKDNQDISEILGQVSYKMSSNLNTYFRYSEKEDGTTDTQRGRIEVRYTF